MQDKGGATEFFKECADERGSEISGLNTGSRRDKEVCDCAEGVSAHRKEGCWV